MDKKGYIKSLYMYNMLIDRMDDPLRRRILIKERDEFKKQFKHLAE